MNKPFRLDARFNQRAGYHTDYGTTASEEKVSDPNQVFRAFRRRLPIFLLIVMAVFSGVAVLTFQATPIYSTSASVIIDARETNVVDFGSVLSGLPPDSAIVDTEVEILRSRTLAEKVVVQLNLIESPEFNARLRTPGAMDQLKTSAKSFVTGLFGGDDADSAIGGSALSSQTEMDSVVSTLLSKTGAYRIGATYGIAVTADSHDPELATAIANQMADQYLIEQLDAKYEATRRANAWIEDRLSDLREELNDAESLVEAYRSASGLYTSGETTLNEQQMTDLNAQLIVQRADLAEREARLAAVRQVARSGTAADASSEALQSPVIAELRRQQSEINREKADLENRYLPNHPEIQRINQEIANVDVQIGVEVRRIVSNLESEVTISRQRLNSLERNLSTMRATLAENNRASVKLRELERNADASRTTYETYLERYKQIDDQEGLAEADARILSRATVPTSPSFPKTSLNLIIGLILGCAFGVGVVIIIETLNSQITAGEEIESNFNVPFLGVFPLLSRSDRKNPGEYLVNNPMSSYAEALRNLRASLIFADLDSMVKTVAITSSQPNEGKSTLTYGLGRMAAMCGSKTLIIDGDFRRRQMSARSVGDQKELGFLECLFGECSVDDAVTIDEKTGLHILPLTTGRNTPRDVFGSKVFDELLDRLKEIYDLIIFDTGPILLMAETRVLASKVDQVVVVAQWLKTNRSALKETLGVLTDFGATITGVLLNQVDVKKYHDRGYGHSGYRSYSTYYTS
ncbi:MAG: polysaccharide biosynthesis tyrosine autokinase [Pseudomonadota bacterium]